MPSLPYWANELMELYGCDAANQFSSTATSTTARVLRRRQGIARQHLRLPGEGDDAALRRRHQLRRRQRHPHRARQRTFFELARRARNAGVAARAAAAVEFLTRYFRYSSNLARLGQTPLQIGFYMKAAHLVAPAVPGALNYDLNALTLLIRDWSTDDALRQHRSSPG